MDCSAPAVRSSTSQQYARSSKLLPTRKTTGNERLAHLVIFFFFAPFFLQEVTWNTPAKQAGVEMKNGRWSVNRRAFVFGWEVLVLTDLGFQDRKSSEARNERCRLTPTDAAMASWRRSRSVAVQVIRISGYISYTRLNNRFQINQPLNL